VVNDYVQISVIVEVPEVGTDGAFFHSVVIDVAHGDSHSPTPSLHTGDLGFTLKIPGSITALVSTDNTISVPKMLDGRAAYQEKVQITVAIIIQEGCAPAHGLYDVLLAELPWTFLKLPTPDPRVTSTKTLWRISANPAAKRA
jgi:hypothetical protein